MASMVAVAQGSSGEIPESEIDDLEVPGTSIMLSFVMAGLGLAVSPVNVAQTSRRLVAIPLADADSSYPLILASISGKLLGKLEKLIKISMLAKSNGLNSNKK